MNELLSIRSAVEDLFGPDVRIEKRRPGMNFQTIEDLVMHLLKETKKDRLFRPRDQREIENKLQELKIELPE